MQGAPTVAEDHAGGLPTIATVADVRSEVERYVAWSATAPHGQRTTTESVDAALRRSRMEVLRTVAAMRASEEELLGPKPTRTVSAASARVHLPPCAARKALYPRRATAHFKTIADLAAIPPVEAAATEDDALPSAEAAVVRRDPRRAVAAKHRAAVTVVRPQIPPKVAEALRAHTRCLGAVKPYSLSRHACHDGSSRCAVQAAADSNEVYIDRMQCCRPSKGLYVYYE